MVAKAGKRKCYQLSLFLASAANCIKQNANTISGDLVMVTLLA
jgi:hypothetical protein